MFDLSNNLKNLRVSKNLTQKEIADNIGITEQSYQRYEYGKVVPSAIKLYELADYFDVSTDYLLGRTDNPNSHKL